MNWLKDQLAERASLNGIWLSSGSHVAAELAAAAGFDWALLDMEHGLGESADILHQIQVLSGTGCTSVVRVPSAVSDRIPRVLDFGAAGVMAPKIESAEQATEFIRALRYPPQGIRGMTRSSRASSYGYDFQHYAAQANAKLTAIVQIETGRAVKQADAIAAVDGVDILFIGHSDLSMDLGCFGQSDAPALQEAESAVLAACRRHGKRAGLIAKSGAAASYRRRGFTFIALGTDIGCFKQGFATLLADNQGESS